MDEIKDFEMLLSKLQFMITEINTEQDNNYEKYFSDNIDDEDQDEK